MTERPGGTYTFLFSDIEGSTKHLQGLGSAWVDVLRTHDLIIRDAAESAGGRAFGSEGDAQNLVFGEAVAAVSAAAEAQRRLTAETWPEGHAIRVRMGIHTGAVQRLGDDFVGLPLHETARITSAGHGGQVLLSSVVHELVRDELPEGVSMRDLGRPVRIFQLDIDGLTSDHPPLRSRSAEHVRLPAQLTSFVGRGEVEAAADLIREQRLVTLIGPGGTGKTRLSIAVGHEVAEDFLDGVTFVPLDAVADPEVVSSEIAAAIGLGGGIEPPLDRIVQHLMGKQVLLVLDNLEQVITAAPSIASLVERAPTVHVLSTSRIPLQVYGEHEFQVPSLGIPPTDDLSPDEAMSFEAVRLFVERARAAKASFAFGQEAVRPVIAIVRRLDGLPLAVELAAARLRMLPLAALHARIDASLAVLSGGGRDRPDRQRTLRGAIAWSHDLLDEPDRRLFARLSVIAGSATLDLIEASCGPADEIGREVFDGVESLSDQSLVRLVDAGDEPRFAMLATIREFAGEQLEASGEEAIVRRRHAEAFTAVAEAAAPHLLGVDGRRWNDALEIDHDDLRAAIDWAVAEGEAEVAMRLVASLWRFWQARGHLHEAKERAERVLDMPGADAVEAGVRARAEGAAGGIDYWRADANAHLHYERAVGFAREADEPKALADALYDLGFVPFAEADTSIAVYVAGRPFFEEARAIYHELGDIGGEAKVLWALHQAAFAEGEMETSIELGQRSLALAREAGDTFLTGWAAYTLALGHATADDWPAVFDTLELSLSTFEASGDTVSIVMVSFAHAQAGLRVGQEEESWRLIGATSSLADKHGAALATANAEIENFRSRREPETAQERVWFDTGVDMGVGEAMALARTIGAATRRSLAKDA